LATKRTKRKVADKSEPSKSDVIREILKANQSAGLKEIRATLDERGVKASDALINKIKYGRNGAKTGGSRKSGNPSKADAIRDMFGALGEQARSRDVIAALAKRGMTVSSAQVSTLRKTLSGRGMTFNASGSHAVSLEHLLAAKNLAERLGGIEAAMQALNSLAKLIQP